MGFRPQEFRYLDLAIFTCCRLLNSMTFEKDTTKRRDIIKKVIAYMTLGIDVSALFSEMCKVGLEMLRDHILEHYLGLKS